MRSLVLVPLAVIVAAAALVVGGYVLGTTQDEPADARDAAGRAEKPGKADRAERESLPARTTTGAGHCDGALVEEKVQEVTVPDGATCVLVDTVVAGNVSVGHDAELALHRSRVGGDVEGEDARAFVAVGSTVSGNLQLEGGGTAAVSGTHVDGDVEWQDQRGRLLLRQSTVGGNVELDENSGAILLVGNGIDGDLECDGNAPAPEGSGNSVRGERKEQCRGL